MSGILGRFYEAFKALLLGRWTSAYTASVIDVPAERVQIDPVHGDGHDPVVGPEDLLDTLAVVDIPVQHHHALDACIGREIKPHQDTNTGQEISAGLPVYVAHVCAQLV